MARQGVYQAGSRMTSLLAFRRRPLPASCLLNQRRSLICSDGRTVAAMSFMSQSHQPCRCFTSSSDAPPWHETAFRRFDYLNVWGKDVAPLNDLVLDKASRFLLQLLQELHLGLLDSPDRPTTARCNRLLQQIHDHKELSGGASRAFEILEGMELFFGIEHDQRFVLPHPNEETFHLVLDTFGKDPTGDPHQARAVIERMESRCADLGKLNLKPNAVNWNCVLRSWAISGDEKKAFHAAKLLNEMREINVYDNVSYGHVLRACALSDMSPKAKTLGVEVAKIVMQEFREKDHVEPTTHIYALFFKACSLQKPSHKLDGLLAEIFRECGDKGYVNTHVLEALRSAASPELFQRLFGTAVADNPSIPALVQRLGRKVSAKGQNPDKAW